eukprot:Filipodium_phascolosomae@DN1190_c0_g1_i1.p1
MTFVLPKLPYAEGGLIPFISAETLSIHHGKHHSAYVGKLNAALASQDMKDSPLKNKSLDELVKEAKGALFNNAAQHWNHSFYWKCMTPAKQGATHNDPTGPIKAEIDTNFKSFAAFKEQFTTEAETHFGSGWVWLVKGPDNKLQILSTHDAGNPLTMGLKPILTCDVWEHAYYIDKQNRRPEYIKSWWNVVNWDFANENL